MNFDALSTAAMATELQATLIGGRVQQVIQINSLTYGFEIYVHPVRHYLILSAEPKAPRLYLSDQKARRGAGSDTPFMLVLRKYMRGVRLKAIIQPPYERLLYFQFENFTGQMKLVLEMLGTRSNLLLLGADQTILGVARLPKLTPNPSAKPSRLLMLGSLYQQPPSQHKLIPADLIEQALQQELAEASPDFTLVQLLPQIISGVSPLVAREIVYRTTGSLHATVGQLSAVDSLLMACRQLFDHLWHNHWQPTLAVDEDGEPIAFAPYPLQHLPNNQTTLTFSIAVQTYFMGVASGYAVAKMPLIEAIKAVRQKLIRRREQLDKDAEARANPTALKEKGEAILAYSSQIKSGQTELVAEWLSGEMLKIRLDASLSPSENAAQYFHNYRKALRAAEEIPTQFDKISLEEHYLDQLEQDVTMADDRAEIDAVADVLVEAGYFQRSQPRQKHHQKATTHYLRLTAPGGAIVWVGKNATQNAHLTFNSAAPDDLWLHARQVPGAHVIMPTAQGIPAEDDVFWAAGVAAYYSRSRHDGSVEVDVTLKKYIRAIKGAAPGLVTCRNESTLRVAPQEPMVDEE